MPFQKISGLGANLLPMVPLSLLPGQAVTLPSGQGVTGGFGGAPMPNQWGSGNPMSGQYLLSYGQYTVLQEYDPGLQYWRTVNVGPQSQIVMSADSANYRVANSTGCPVGALITTAGSGLTNGFNTVTITPSAGGSTWNTLVGGAINATVTITAGGSGYTRPPVLVVAPPANQGQNPYILPTITATLTTGAISTVTVVNQGAGLVAAPTITIVPQSGDSGGGAVLTVNATLALTGQLLAMWPITYGNTGAGLTAAPTFTFSPAGPAATAIMNWTITSFAAGTAGVGYVAAGGAFNGGIVAGTAANNSPGNAIYDKALSLPVFPPVTVTAATGLPALAGPFGGVNIQAVPTFSAFSTGAAATTAAVTTVNVGGATDTFFIQSI